MRQLPLFQSAAPSSAPVSTVPEASAEVSPGAPGFRLEAVRLERVERQTVNGVAARLERRRHGADRTGKG